MKIQNLILAPIFFALFISPVSKAEETKYARLVRVSSAKTCTIMVNSDDTDKKLWRSVESTRPDGFMNDMVSEISFPRFSRNYFNNLAVANGADAVLAQFDKNALKASSFASQGSQGVADLAKKTPTSLFYFVYNSEAPILVYVNISQRNKKNASLNDSKKVETPKVAKLTDFINIVCGEDAN